MAFVHKTIISPRSSPTQAKGNPMRIRLLAGLLAFVVCLVAVAAALPQSNGVDGNWKITFVDGPDLLTFWLLKLDTKDGKLTGTVDPAPKAPQATIQNAALQDSTLRFTLDLGGQPIQFALRVPKGDSKRLMGIMKFRDESYPVQLEATKDDNAKGFDAIGAVKIPKGDFKELKDEVAKHSDDLGVFAIARALVSAAIADKVPAADLKAALVPVFQAARNYGGWDKEMLFQFARQVAGRDGFAALGEDLAQQALKAFGNDADSAIQLRCLDIIALSLLKQDKKDELTRIRARIGELEVKGHEENEKTGLGYTPAKVESRKGQRVVLVELFTGAQCPPCVAADLAFEGLGKTYTPSEVVLLQYHLHIPLPDPLTTPDTQARANFYGEDVRGTPTIFFNGKSAAGGGGPRPAGEAKYKDYRAIIDPLLEEANKIAVKVDAKRTDDNIAITATAAGYKPSDKLKLRFALIEPWVRYAGTNGLSYHAHVVRALPGGPAGFELTKDSAMWNTKVDLADIRQSASKHLDGFPYLDGQRPFSFRNLRVVAFIQNDDTKEVLHAVDVAVK
jgi:hypothetical protein